MEISKLTADLAGNRVWFLPNGHIHRSDGPAVILINGAKHWWVNGKRHRIDGPAYESAAEPKQWYINGKSITDEVNEWMVENNISYPFDEEAQVQFKLRFL